MEVVIKANDLLDHPGYSGVRLKVPATKEEIQEALDLARVSGDWYVVTKLVDWPLENDKRIQTCSMTLEEVNFLARKICNMNKQEVMQYKASLEYRLQHKNLRQLSAMYLINAAYQIDQFQVLPGIQDDEKLGAYMRQKEGGFFADGCYCVKSVSGWEQVYDGRHLPLEEKADMKSLLSVCLKKNGRHTDEAAVWVSCPAGPEEIRTAVLALHAGSINECHIADVKCVVPHLMYVIDSSECMEEVNALAERLGKMDAQSLLKMKAVLEYEDCENLSHTMELMEQMDRYSVDTRCISYANYGRSCLESTGIDWRDPVFQNVDLEQYGKEQCRRAGMRLTPYGLVAKDKNPEEVQGEEQAKEAGMHMGGIG